MGNTCTFCQIAENKINVNTVLENDLIKCFLDIDPINEGHILIIPQKHYLDADELPDEVACEIMRTSQKILKTLRRCYTFPGYSIMQNGGKFNDIGHYHMHIFPRYEQDGFSWAFDANKAHACNKQIACRIVDALRTV